MSRGRPAHLSLPLIGLVAVGGALGTAARAGLDQAFAAALATVTNVAVVTVCINVVGSFALGLLTGSIARRGAESAAATRMRLFAGTGVLGGFTTYSAFAISTASLLGAPGAGAVDAFAALVTVATTLGVGVAGAWGGFALGLRRGRPTADETGA